MKTKLIINLMLMLTTCLGMYAQGKTVSGTVKDTDGFTVPGANIIIKGTGNGTISDLDGNYTLSNVAINDVLVFSFVGLEAKEIVFKGQQPLDVVLESSAIALQEVVAIGYGVKKKSVVTGSISSLDADELLKAKPANPVNALNGRVSGVTVIKGSGQPGAVPKLVIRGVGTNGNSSPLFVIDGLPMSDMNSVNPNDIKSMEVLKDATSTAIYGARGANGVVLITTKKGKKGQTSLSYDGYFGWSSVQRRPTMLNTDQYITLMQEFYRNDNLPYPSTMPTKNEGIDTDWLGALFNTAPVTEHNVTATMGSEKGSTLLSLGYLDQNGIMGGDKSYFTRYSVRSNSQYDINDYVTVGANVNYNFIDRNTIGSGKNGFNILQYAFQMDPATPVYDEVNGDSYGYGMSHVPFSRMWNPLAHLEIASNGKTQQQKFYGNAYIEITPIKNLVFKSDVGANINTLQARSYAPSYEHNMQINDKTMVQQNSNTSVAWQWENTLRYQRAFGEHDLSVLLGTTASRNNYNFLKGSRQNMPEEALRNPNYWYLNAGDVNSATNEGGANPTHSIYSVFGRLSYNYAERYMTEFVIRRDGSSNFGHKNRFATFPGVSVGWNVSNEKFWKLKDFQTLKLRLSWGQNGNEAISPFSYTSIIGNMKYYTFGMSQSVTPGSAPNSLVNSDVKWETSEQINFGADFGLFKGKIRGSVDLFRKTTKDLLFRPTLESVRGNIAAFQNVGKIANEGVEFQLTYRTNINKVNLSLSGNASYLQNEVIKIGNSNGYLEGGMWRNGGIRITRMEEGFPIGYFYGYKTNGIFQNEADIQNYKNSEGKVIQPNAKPGDFKWFDRNDNGRVDSDDRVNIGNPWPKWTYGATISADWNGFDFNMFLSGKADFDVFTAQYRGESYGKANLPSFYLDRWQKDGDITSVPRLSVKNANGNFSKPSDFYVYDGSYLKIGGIEVGYSFPEKWIKSALLSKARVYVAVDNVATFTNYPFLDPEVGSVGDNNILETGIDYSMYPLARTFRVGFNLKF